MKISELGDQLTAQTAAIEEIDTLPVTRLSVPERGALRSLRQEANRYRARLDAGGRYDGVAPSHALRALREAGWECPACGPGVGGNLVVRRVPGQRGKVQVLCQHCRD